MTLPQVNIYSTFLGLLKTKVRTVFASSQSNVNISHGKFKICLHQNHGVHLVQSERNLLGFIFVLFLTFYSDESVAKLQQSLWLACHRFSSPSKSPFFHFRSSFFHLNFEGVNTLAKFSYLYIFCGKYNFQQSNQMI